MISIENNCVGCEHCICCGAKSVSVMCCDLCESSEGDFYAYNGDLYCSDCLYNMIIADELVGDKREQIRTIGSLFGIDTYETEHGIYLSETDTCVSVEETYSILMDVIQEYASDDFKDFLEHMGYEDWKKLTRSIRRNQ